MGATTTTRPVTFATFAALAADVTSALFAERAQTWRTLDAIRTSDVRAEGMAEGHYVRELEHVAMAIAGVDSLVDQYRSDPTLPLADALSALATLAPSGSPAYFAAFAAHLNAAAQ